MIFAYRTDTGKRARNEDSLYFPQTDSAKQLYIVADGMGGHRSGAVASREAVSAVAEYFEQSTGNDMVTLATVAAAYANARVYSLATEQPMYQGMGTTLCFCCLDENRFVAANIGDSRLYHFDGVALTQVTHDHSFVAALLLAGEITEDEAENHSRRNVITRAIGVTPLEHADVFEYDWKKGDIILLCTDGLPVGVSNADIRDLLRGTDDLETICDELISMAREGGSTDNVTIILVKNDPESNAHPIELDDSNNDEGGDAK